MAINGERSAPPPPPQWVLDLNAEIPERPKASGTFTNPPGYTASASVTKRGASSNTKSVSQRNPPSTEEMELLKMKKAWEQAIAPAKSLPMSAIGMYMAGNSLQIFSIFMLFTLFRSPVTGLMNTNTTFEKFQTEQNQKKMIPVKMIYILTNLLTLALGLYKLNSMGLLPTTRSDWLAWESQRMPLERAYPAYGL